MVGVSLEAALLTWAANLSNVGLTAAVEQSGRPFLPVQQVLRLWQRGGERKEQERKLTHCKQGLSVLDYGIG